MDERVNSGQVSAPCGPDTMDAYIALKDVYHDLSALYRKKHGEPWAGADVDPLREDELHFALRHLSCALSALACTIVDVESSPTQEQLDDARRELTKRGFCGFPDGFEFGYNNRRGDPQFTPYWYLRYNGEDVSHFNKGLRFPNEKAAKAAALEAATRLNVIYNGTAD